MADKEFTQICKEILGIGKRLEKIEPEELREIKASIERLSEAFNASKALFDESKNDFDGKYNKVAQIVETFDTLKAQIEEVLKSGVINDDTNGLISTYSSKKITDLFNKAMTLSDNRFASKTESESKYAALSQNISTLQSSLSSGLSNAYNKQESDDKFALKTDFENYKDTDGYTKLPNGLIIQWGKAGKYPPNTTKIKEVLNFPITFPNKCLIIASHINDNAIGDDAHASDANQNRNIYAKTNYITKNGFTYTMHTPVDSIGLGWEFYWIAIGY